MGDVEQPKLDIVPREVEYNIHTIELLERWLEMARHGEIHSIVLAGYNSDSGSYIMNWSPTLDIAQRIGMIELIKLDWMSEKVLEKL